MDLPTIRASAAKLLADIDAYMAPVPDPVPDPTPDPTPDPVPDPTPDPAPVPSDWRAVVDGYRTRQFTGMATPAMLSVTGTKVLDGYRHVSPATTIQRCVEVYPGGDLTLRNFELLGSGGAAENKIGVITRTADPDKAGRLDMADGRIDGMSADWIKIAGIPGQQQAIRRVHFGPQWATAGSTTHADFITFLGVLGDILIEDCVFERTLAPGRRIAGLNNWLRIVPNKGSTMKGANRINIRRCVVYSDPLQSYLIQRQRYSDGVPFLDLQDVFLPVSRIGMAKVFYPGFDMSLLRWVNVRDTYTGSVIPAPAGAQAV